VGVGFRVALPNLRGGENAEQCADRHHGPDRQVHQADGFLLEPEFAAWQGAEIGVGADFLYFLDEAFAEVMPVGQEETVVDAVADAEEQHQGVGDGRGALGQVNADVDEEQQQSAAQNYPALID
jgi:hypothetical protein